MKVFDAYAGYYDLIYREKDYEMETDYILRFVRKHKPDAKTILDLGCGTGKHDLILSRKGFHTTGVELSGKMYSAAVKLLEEKENQDLALKFYKGDLRKINLLNKYDVIISLFHVINYQTKNEDLDSFLKTVKKHLKKNGIFIFDFWYGPAVLSDRPVRKKLKIKDGDIEINRDTKPEMRVNENLAVINFNIEVKNKKSGETEKFMESHNMRYLFLPEIDAFCEKYELKNIYSKEWLTGKTLSDNTWYGLSVLKNLN